MLEVEPFEDDFPAAARRRSFLLRRLYKPAFELVAIIDLACSRVSRISGTIVAADVPGELPLVAVELEPVSDKFSFTESNMVDAC